MKSASTSQRTHQLLLLSILCLTILVNSAQADTPELFVEDRVGGMTIQGTTLYWYANCGDEFSPLRSMLRGKPSQDAPGLSNQVTLYYPQTCQPNRIASTNVAVDETNIYWIAGDGRIMSLPRNSVGTVAPVEMRRTGLGSGTSNSIAVDGNYFYWGEPNRLMRASKTSSTTAAETIYTGLDVRLIRPAGDGSIYFISGTRLVVLQPFGRFFLPRYIDGNVRDYALDGSRVYWTSNVGGTSYIRSQVRGVPGGSSLLYTADSRTPEINSLVVDATSIYAQTRQRAGGGPILRLPLGGGAATAITAFLNIGNQLLSDGEYLFWVDHNTGIYRLRINASPIASPNGNIWVTGIEVTQGIQVPNNLVPLVGYKATVVRVYAQSQEDSNGPWRNVLAQLSVSGSTAVHGSPNINVSSTGSNPRTNDDSFTFRLNRDETAPGGRDLTVRISGISGRPETSAADNQLTIHVNFGPERYLTMLGYTYGNRNNSALCRDAGAAPDDYVPPFSNFEVHRQYLENAYPVSSITIVPMLGSGQTFDNNQFEGTDNPCGANWRAGGAMIRTLAVMLGGSERAYRLMPEQGRSGWCCNFVNGHSVPEGQDARGDPGVTMSQEIGHSYRGVFLNQHTFDAGFGYPRTNHMAYSDDDGGIGPWIGVELAPTSRLIPGETADRRPAAWDFMSYHPVQPYWVSPYTYCKLLNYMSGGTVLCPATVEGGGMARGFVAPQTFGETAQLTSLNSFFAHPTVSEISGETQGKQGTRTFLYVAGDVSAEGHVTLAPFDMTDDSKDLTTRPLGKTYTLRLEDAEGKALEDFSFDVSPLHSTPPKEMRHSMIAHPMPFNFYVPWNPSTARIVILKDQTELASRVVSLHVPKISSLTFASGKSVGGKQILSWEATDEDGDKLTYSVWYSRDGGQNWMPIAAYLSEDFLAVDFDRLPGAKEALLRVLASDGVNTSQEVTQKAFAVPFKGPQITLSGPDDEAAFNEKQEFLVAATAFSYESGAITDARAFIWQDETGGKLGVGPWIVPHLSPGKHRISLTVRDATGMASTAYRNLLIKAGANPITPLNRPTVNQISEVPTGKP
jgi:hypothetical protein